MDSKTILRELVKETKNKNNNQISLHIRKTKLKDLDIDIEELLDTPIKNKLERFKSG